MQGRPILKFASLSDRGKMRLSNEDAAGCDDRMGFFLVSDGMGGLPAGGAASRVIVHAMPPLVQRGLDLIGEEAEDQLVQTVLHKATTTLSRHMHQKSRVCTGLNGWGATLVGVLLRGHNAHLINVGDSRVYLLREKNLVQLTSDDSVVNKLLEEGMLVTADFEHQHHNMVLQHIAMKETVTPAVRIVQMQKGDRLLLCTDGLTEPVPDHVIGQLLLAHTDPSRASQALTTAANDGGGPDNITVLVIDWRGIRKADPTPPKLPTIALEPISLPREAGRMHETLLKLEKELDWLYQGSNQTHADSRIGALATAKRLLGTETYMEYMQRHPTDNPSHVFHQLCIDPKGSWRRKYDGLLQSLDPQMLKLTSGQIGLSPLLSNEGAALILRTLWTEFRTMERKYLSISNRDAFSREERSLNILLKHMHESIRTLMGLIQFLPTFAC